MPRVARTLRRKLPVSLFMVFKDTDISIQIFDLDLRAARIDARAGKAIRAENGFPAAMVFLQRMRWKRIHRKVAIHATVHGLKAEVGRKAASERQFHVAI